MIRVRKMGAGQWHVKIIPTKAAHPQSQLILILNKHCAKDCSVYWFGLRLYAMCYGLSLSLHSILVTLVKIWLIFLKSRLKRLDPNLAVFHLLCHAV
jgi:hypothetical protein